jgi:hypothetical protein
MSSSILIKLNYAGHIHNGRVCGAGEKIRVPDDVAVSMQRRGQCQYVTGKDLSDDRVVTKQRREARAAKAESKGKDRK